MLDQQSRLGLLAEEDVVGKKLNHPEDSRVATLGADSQVKRHNSKPGTPDRNSRSPKPPAPSNPEALNPEALNPTRETLP